MKSIIIGSNAMKLWFSDFNREPKDIDIMYDSELIKGKFKVNLHLPKESTNKKIEYLQCDLVSLLDDYNGFITPESLLTLKMSHIFWDINFDKHMWDIQFLIKKGVKYNNDIFLQLYQYWNTYHGRNKRSDLKMSAEDFFDNALKCPHDHDYLHTLINITPTYTKVLRDGCEVEPDENKFNSFSHEDKINLVKEEIYVMAYERYYDMGYRHAYGKMLKKFLLSHAPLWEALFVIENWIELNNPKQIINFKEIINGKLGITETIKF